jgi:neutral ceramidase
MARTGIAMPCLAVLSLAILLQVFTTTAIPLKGDESAGGLFVGTAMTDATGPVADVNFMGYAKPGQNGHGLHFRLRARAYVVANRTDGVGCFPAGCRFAFVSVDFGMASHAVTQNVLEMLEAHPTTKGLFSYQNLCISGTHTHSAPGGFLTHTIFQVTSYGFVKQAYEAYSSAIAKAVIKATANMRPARVFLNRGKLLGANINRSPTSYLRNPQSERDQYADGNTDKDMTLLKFIDAKSGAPVGMVNWFSVHGTSMNNTNTLVSGDNRGYASYLFERRMNGNSTLTGQGAFVAAFASTNLGDVSPNTLGPYCMDTGLPCDTLHSTCNNRTEMCVARGPGKDMFESTEIIGRKQADFAQQLYDSATEELTEQTIDARQAWVDMTNYTFTLPSGETVSTCPPAMGYGFAAGTTDGPGAFNFVQGTNSTNPFWNIVSRFISAPTPAVIKCHAPKPILLNVGGISEPYPWAAHTVPLQLVRLGRFFLVSLPSELTTMAGRRMRAAIAAEVKKLGLHAEPVIAIAGLSNEYADYTTTFEEYQAQRYEAASTAYGPHELEAFIHAVLQLVRDMGTGKNSSSMPVPPTYLDKQISLEPGVIFDRVDIGKHFGDVTKQPAPSAKSGDVVSVEFRSACPRNDLRTEGTYLTVEMQHGNDWKVVAVDGDWETRFKWYRHSSISAESFATIEWHIPAGTAAGTYRIRHFNAHKNLLGTVTQFNGTSNTFTVVAGAAV